MCGLALGAAAFAVVGLVNSFAVFIAMYAVAGLGNTAYHPANYSLLSHHSPPSRIGQIFSIHTFCRNARFGGRTGDVAGDAEPGRLARCLYRRRNSRLRGACAPHRAAAAAADQLTEKRRAKPAAGNADASSENDAGWRLLLSPPILLNLGFFVLISLMGGLNNFLVVALGALYGTPDTLANVALTGLLLMNAFGVLVGGVLASRTKRHAAVAALGLAFAGIVIALVGLIGFSSYALVLMTSLSGLFVGIATPSRDMLVRAVTPPGAFGSVFGFVSSGFNIGSMFAPMIYGLMMDHGQPRAVFLFSAACSILCIGTVIFITSVRERR